MKIIIMIINMTIKEIEKMIKKIYIITITMIIMKMNEAIKDQNYHTILINTAKDIINENITLRMIYY